MTIPITAVKIPFSELPDQLQALKGAGEHIVYRYHHVTYGVVYFVNEAWWRRSFGKWVLLGAIG